MADERDSRVKRALLATIAAGQHVRGVGDLVARAEPYLATGHGPSKVIHLDYAVDPAPRYGYGRPVNEPIRALLAAGAGEFEKSASAVLAAAAWMDEVPRYRLDALTPWWENPYIPVPDAVAICGYLAAGARRYVEIGSGESTKFARACIERLSLGATITSVDPQPRAQIDELADQVVRQPIEGTDLALFDDLGPGDVVFVDNSHRILPNSDCTVVFMEVLPRLAGSGVIVGFHDIFLPLDYPPEFRPRFYSEQYGLAAYLLGGDRLTVLLPVHYLLSDERLGAPFESFMRGIESREGDSRIPVGSRNGVSFWVRT